MFSCDLFDGKNRVVEYVESLPGNLDPALSDNVYSANIYSNIYESLVQLDTDGFTIRPGLARNWRVENNLTRYVFNLEPGRFFHDGSPVNADAVVYSFLRQIRLNKSAPLFNIIQNVESIDSLQIAINLEYPYTQFLYSLTSPVGLKVISKKALQKSGDSIIKEPLGSGPFYLSEWKTDSHITLKKYPHFPKFPGDVEILIFKQYADYSELVKNFKWNEFDVFYSIPGFYIDRLKWLGRIEYKIGAPSTVVFLGFNCSAEPLNDIGVRKAILNSINRTKLVNHILRGNSVVAQGPLPSVFAFAKEQSAKYLYDPEPEDLRTIGLLKENLNLKLFFVSRFMTRTTILEALEKEFQKIGIKLEMIPFESYAALNQACRGDSAQLFLNNWQADVLGDPENFLYSLFYSSSDYNFFQYMNPRVDRWLDSARVEPAWEKRQILYQKIVEQVIDDTPAVFLYYTIPVYAYNKQKIKSLPVNPYGIINYQQVLLND